MNPTKSNRNLQTPMSQTLKRSLTFRFLLVGLLALMFAGVQTAQAVNSIAYTNQLTFSQSGISSTSGVPLIYIPSNPYAVGDLIYFNGTTTANNPFTSANRYYVIYSSGNNIKVATTFNGTAANAVNSITAAATAQQHPDWLSGANWFGGAAPNDNNSFASFPSAGGGATPPGGVVISGNVTTYGLGYANSSQDLEILSGSSNNLSLYPITFATADSTTPKITSTNASAGVIFLGNSSQAASLKINGTQGLIFNAGPGGAVTGSGTAATSSGPGKDIRVFNTVNWADFSGGVQIERGQVSQQNGASVLPSTQNLTVGNNQTTANNLLAALSLNARDCTVGALNGVALGRIFNSSGTSIFTVGNNNADGNYAGSIGYNFDGTFPNANLWLHKAGTGTQTISGPIAGTNTTVTVDAGDADPVHDHNHVGISQPRQHYYRPGQTRHVDVERNDDGEHQQRHARARQQLSARELDDHQRRGWLCPRSQSVYRHPDHQRQHAHAERLGHDQRLDRRQQWQLGHQHHRQLDRWHRRLCRRRRGEV